MDVQIAHIRDAHPGNRFDSSMTDEDRRSFANLVLLCKPHHDLVDRAHPDRYQAEDLSTWKALREEGMAENLLGALEVDEAELEGALKDAAINISVSQSSLQIGGMGGSAVGAGGGGGGVIGSGTGGPGGPGGAITLPGDAEILLDGPPGEAPGAGGGGGGAMTQGAIVRSPDPSAAREGVGFSSGVDGTDGGASSVAIEGRLLLSAAGGLGGLAGTGIRSVSDRIAVSVLMLVNYVELREGFAYVAGGAWQNISVLNLPSMVPIATFAVFEAAGTEAGEYTIGLEARDPDGTRRSRMTFPLTVSEPGDVLRVCRCCNLSTEIDSFGLWRVLVDCDGRELVGVDFLVKRTGES
jgi:hypothetical protein